jgi:hypothetical protein
MKSLKLSLFELPPEALGALPLCYHRIYTQDLYSAPERSAMELASRRYDSVEALPGGSEKLISKIWLADEHDGS